MAIFIGCAYIYTIIITAIGPENKGGSLQGNDADLDNIDYVPEERV
jgi:hypothetical protein